MDNRGTEFVALQQDSCCFVSFAAASISIQSSFKLSLQMMNVQQSWLIQSLLELFLLMLKDEGEDEGPASLDDQVGPPTGVINI